MSRSFRDSVKKPSLYFLRINECLFLSFFSVRGFLIPNQHPHFQGWHLLFQGLSPGKFQNHTFLIIDRQILR